MWVRMVVLIKVLMVWIRIIVGKSIKDKTGNSRGEAQKQ